MAAVASPRAGIILFSDPSCPDSHRTRFVLKEKGIEADIIDVDYSNPPEELLSANPFGKAPTLLDRNVPLYPSQVIIEYLDERFPHPPLMPVDPMSRAQNRLMGTRVEKEWYSLLDDIENGSDRKKSKAKKALREAILSSSEVFAAKPFFLSDELTVVDCSVGVLLWRLKHYGIELPPNATAIHQYAQRIFQREGFRESLSPIERTMN